MVRLVSVVILVVLVVGISGQIPGMDMLNNIMANVGRMSSQMYYMNDAMMRDGIGRAQAGRRYGPGETRFRTADGGTGFVYNSPDGTSSSYSFSSGGPSRGFAYSYGPDGGFRRQW